MTQTLVEYFLQMIIVLILAMNKYTSNSNILIVNSAYISQVNQRREMVMTVLNTIHSGTLDRQILCVLITSKVGCYDWNLYNSDHCVTAEKDKKYNYSFNDPDNAQSNDKQAPQKKKKKKRKGETALYI